MELEGKSGLAATFGRPNLEDREFEPFPGVNVLPIAPDEALMEYLEDHGLGRISRRLTSTGAIDVISTAVPGMKDILVLGKVKALQRARVADVIMVDGPAAGHAVTFLLSSKGLLDAVRVGPVLTQAMEVTEMLADADRARVMLVTLPEETPVNETVETAKVLIESAGLGLAPLVVNGLYADRSLATDPEGIRAAAEAAGVPVPDSELEHLALAAEFHTRRRALQAAQLERLNAALDLPQVRLPFLFTAELGPAELDVLAGAVTEGLEAVGAPHDRGWPTWPATAMSWCAAAAAAWARRPPPPPWPSKVPGGDGTRWW